MDKFKLFKVKLLKKLQERISLWRSYSRGNKEYCYHDYYLDLNCLWISYLKITGIEVDVTSLIKHTFKKIKKIPYLKYKTLQCPVSIGDKIMYDKLIKTLHKVGFKHCGVRLKTTHKICEIVCTVEQKGCGIHAKKERLKVRKVKIHQFLKTQFDPIGLRDLVNLTANYTITLKGVVPA